MTVRARRALFAASVFGICDGMTSILGVVVAARSHPEFVPWFATVGGIGAGLSMAVGQYVSEDNDDSVPADLTLGAATFVGSVLPSLPYLLLHGAPALALTAAICLALAILVGVLRAGGSLGRGVLVVGLLALVLAVTLGCALLAPTGGA